MFGGGLLLPLFALVLAPQLVFSWGCCMVGFVGNVVGVAGGVLAVEAVTKLQAPLHSAEGVYSRWPRRVAAAVVAIGGFAVASKLSKGSFGYEAAEGLAMAGVTQLVQQLYGEIL